MISGLVFIGCETDQIDPLPQTESVGKQLEVVDTEVTDSPMVVNPKNDDEWTAAFANANEWFAYYTAKTLMVDVPSRFAFGTKLGNGNTVSASHLLDDSTPNAFRDMFRFMVWQKVCSDIDCGRPEIPGGGPPPPTNPGDGDGGPVMGGILDGTVTSMKSGGGGLSGGGSLYMDAWQITDNFIDYITNTACLELYIPVTLDYTGGQSLYPVAHPLNDNASNTGFKYYPSPVPQPDGTQIESVAHPINMFTVTNLGNVIVSRPVDDPWTSGCGYSAFFGVSDFTLFLDF